MKEKWKTVNEHPNYEVSDLGRVRNKKTRHVLSPAPHSHGYRTIQLGRGNRYYVHHLVLEAFVCQRTKSQEVNHRNGVKSDNRLVNLEYLTASDNQLHAVKTGLKKHGAKAFKAKLEEWQVMVAALDVASGDSYSVVARKFDVSPATIRDIWKRRTWKHTHVRGH